MPSLSLCLYVCCLHPGPSQRKLQLSARPFSIFALLTPPSPCFFFFFLFLYFLLPLRPSPPVHSVKDKGIGPHRPTGNFLSFPASSTTKYLEQNYPKANKADNQGQSRNYQSRRRMGSITRTFIIRIVANLFIGGQTRHKAEK